MRKWIIAVAIFAALAGCKSTDTQNAAPVEDRAAAEAAKDSASTKGVGARASPARPVGPCSIAIPPTCCRKSEASISNTTSS